jgi:hypothetical protein
MMTALRRIAITSSSLVILISFPAFGRQIKPVFNPANFSPGSPNQYFPLVQGMVWEYSADSGETERAEVLSAPTTHCAYPKTVAAGVTVSVVQDQVFDEDGNLIEDTCDWYAPDNESNVWYLGEDSQDIDPTTGEVVSTEGSWEAGVDGAQAGIIMEANPRIGDKYRQESAPGVAEDVGQVVGLHKSVSVPADAFEDCIKTLDSSRLSPGAREHKYYCPDVGLVLEVSPSGGRERNELTDVSP